MTVEIFNWLMLVKPLKDEFVGMHYKTFFFSIIHMKVKS